MERYFILENKCDGSAEKTKEEAKFISCENLLNWSIIQEMGSILDKTLCPVQSNFLSCPESPL
jgi:hypothetical protein